MADNIEYIGLIPSAWTGILHVVSIRRDSVLQSSLQTRNPDVLQSRLDPSLATQANNVR